MKSHMKSARRSLSLGASVLALLTALAACGGTPARAPGGAGTASSRALPRKCDRDSCIAYCQGYGECHGGRCYCQ